MRRFKLLISEVGSNIAYFFSDWWHILGIVIIVLGLVALATRKYYAKRLSDKFNIENIDIVIKTSVLICVTIGAIVSLI